MKKHFFLFPIILLVLGFYAGHIIDENAQSLLNKIKLTDDEAKNTIFSDITGPSFYFPGIRELKSIAINDRASQVEIIVQYVKDFTKTEEFKKRYNEFRETRKPSPPEKPKTMAELKKESKQNLQQSIEEMKTTKAAMPADQQAMFDETVNTLEEQLKEMDDPNNTLFSPEMDKYNLQAYEMQMDQHKKEISDWETKYPANNSNLLIKSWLQSFLEQSQGVDFNAQTAIDNNRTLFVKQEYERKDYLWKLCFRGGKETTESGRKFAQSWMGELKQFKWKNLEIKTPPWRGLITIEKSYLIKSLRSNLSETERQPSLDFKSNDRLSVFSLRYLFIFLNIAPGNNL